MLSQEVSDVNNDLVEVSVMPENVFVVAHVGMEVRWVLYCHGASVNQHPHILKEPLV